ncbi:MAG: AI-2E family transporter [Cytophagales bacterium]
MIQKFNYEKYYPNIALAVMVVLGMFLFYSLSMFLNALLGAIIMFILTRPMMIWFTEKKKWNNILSTMLTMAFSFIVFVILIGGIFYLLIGRVSELVSNPEQLFAIFDKIHLFINEKLQFDILTPENVATLKSTTASLATIFLDQTFTVVTDIGIMYFILFFMLASRKTMESTILFYMPYKQEKIDLFTNELKAQTYSNAIVTPLLALIQGVTASIGYWLLGVQEPIFWGFMTGVFSFMPIVGCMTIWVPLSVFTLANGQTWNGIGIIIYSILVTTNIDNVFRLILQKKFADAHPLITLMGFLMGIKYFGISGIIIGPVLMSFFLIMVKNFRKEFMDAPSDVEKEKI